MAPEWRCIVMSGSCQSEHFERLRSQIASYEKLNHQVADKKSYFQLFLNSSWIFEKIIFKKDALKAFKINEMSFLEKSMILSAIGTNTNM